MSVSSSANSRASNPFRFQGEVCAHLQAMDWSGNLLGEPSGWPDGLREAVSFALPSAHPMVVFWGPRLVCIYNDAFRRSLGPEKHPRVLAQPLRTAFQESYPLLEPEIASVLAGEPPIWRENQRLPLHRHGILTDSFWSYSVSPLMDGEAIGGAIFVGGETTAYVHREAILTAEDASLRMSLDAGRIGSWTLDLAREVFECSASCKINFGRNPHASFSLAQLKAAVHPDDRDRLERGIERAVERGEDFDAELRVPRPNGRDSWVLIRGRVAYGLNGEPLSMAGVTMDVSGRRHAEEHLRLMVDELNHRVKNTLATVQSITRQTLGRSQVAGSVREDLDSRLTALSAAHNILTDEQWSGADLTPIVRTACAPFGGQARFDVAGPSVRLSPRIAIALALAFHELSTNATKYGALSTPEGHVSVNWHFVDEGDATGLQIRWEERGGPPVSPPTREGFGSRMIKRSLAPELGGRVELDFRPGGLVCDLSVQLSPSVLKARGVRLLVARDGDSWTVGDDVEVLQWFETQSEAISFVTEQLNALRVKGRSGTVIFNTTGPNDPPARRRRRLT